MSKITRIAYNSSGWLRPTVFQPQGDVGAAHRGGRNEADTFQTYLRKAVAPILCTPEHRRMQARLMELLRKEVPGARIVCEEDYVDVTLETSDRRTLFEIKTDLVPCQVIRQALGQLLEYGYRRHQDGKKLDLVIVGRAEATSDDERYLERLRSEFGLPITYRALSLSV